MAQVCLFHAGRYQQYGDTTWREGGTDSCTCERVTDAIARLRAEAAWARQDERAAAAHAEELEQKLAELEGSPV